MPASEYPAARFINESTSVGLRRSSSARSVRRVASARDAAAASGSTCARITVDVDGHDQGRLRDRVGAPDLVEQSRGLGQAGPRPGRVAEVVSAFRALDRAEPPIALRQFELQGSVGAGARRQAVEELHGAIEQQPARLGGPRHPPRASWTSKISARDISRTWRKRCCALSRSAAATRACQAVAATPATSVIASAAAAADRAAVAAHEAARPIGDRLRRGGDRAAVLPRAQIGSQLHDRAVPLLGRLAQRLADDPVEIAAQRGPPLGRRDGVHRRRLDVADGLYRLERRQATQDVGWPLGEQPVSTTPSE
jgi:hypothetical protein